MPLWSLLLAAAAALFLIVYIGQKPDGSLHVWVLDVGQGDSIFLRTPAGHTALIDGGPAATPLLNGLGEHVPFWQHSLDLVVLTHPHDDHMTGLVELAHRWSIGQVVQTEFTPTLAVQGEWLQAIKERGTPVHLARSGDKISFDGEPDLTLRVLSPTSPDVPSSRQDDGNNSSIVLRLEYDGHTVLFEGDAQASVEARLAAEWSPDDLRADVLKVGHHGSANASTPEFVQLVSPKAAIISVGAGNRFGHPATQTLDTLAQAGARIYRTDTNGEVEIIADSENLWVRSER